MNKRLWGIIVLGVCLLATGFYFAVRGWAGRQALRAIETAADAKASFAGMTLEAWAGRVTLHRLVLTPRDASVFWKRLEVETVTGRILWSERGGREIPMDAVLNHATLQLREPQLAELLRTSFRIPSQPTSGLNIGALSEADDATDSGLWRITLTALEAKNFSVIAEGTFSEDAIHALASGLDVTARRGMRGWQGVLTADKLGPDAFPLTQVKAELSTESSSTRIAQFHANLCGGTLSGGGWYSVDGTLVMQFTADALSVSELAPPWTGVTGGVLSGEFHYQGDPLRWRETGTLRGRFALKDGALDVSRFAMLFTDWLAASFAEALAAPQAGAPDGETNTATGLAGSLTKHLAGAAKALQPMAQKLPGLLSPVQPTRDKTNGKAGKVGNTDNKEEVKDAPRPTGNLADGTLYLDLFTGQLEHKPEGWKLSDLDMKATDFLALHGELQYRKPMPEMVQAEQPLSSADTTLKIASTAPVSAGASAVSSPTIEVDLKVGLAKKFLHTLGLNPAPMSNEQSEKNSSGSLPSDVNAFHWTVFHLKTNPEQFWQQLFAELLATVTPSPAAVAPSAPASNSNAPLTQSDKTTPSNDSTLSGGSASPVSIPAAPSAQNQDSNVTPPSNFQKKTKSAVNSIIDVLTR